MGSVLMAFLIAVTVTASSPADATYLGKWKVNLAKSELSGFAATWKSTETKTPAATLQLAPTMNGLAMKDDLGFQVSGKFDGRDYPGNGRVAGGKYTFVFKQTSDHSFEMTTKIDGKPNYLDVYTVS